MLSRSLEASKRSKVSRSVLKSAVSRYTADGDDDLLGLDDGLALTGDASHPDFEALSPDRHYDSSVHLLENHFFRDAGDLEVEELLFPGAGSATPGDDPLGSFGRPSSFSQQLPFSLHSSQAQAQWEPSPSQLLSGFSPEERHQLRLYDDHGLGLSHSSGGALVPESLGSGPSEGQASEDPLEDEFPEELEESPHAVHSRRGGSAAVPVRRPHELSSRATEGSDEDYLRPLSRSLPDSVPESHPLRKTRDPPSTSLGLQRLDRELDRPEPLHHRLLDPNQEGDSFPGSSGGVGRRGKAPEKLSLAEFLELEGAAEWEERKESEETPSSSLGPEGSSLGGPNPLSPKQPLFSGFPANAQTRGALQLGLDEEFEPPEPAGPGETLSGNDERPLLSQSLRSERQQSRLFEAQQADFSRTHSRPLWEPVLFRKQPYPDNYVDPSFLGTLVTNANVLNRPFSAIIFDSVPIVQRVSFLVIFLLVFYKTLVGALSWRALLGFDAALLFLGAYAGSVFDSAAAASSRNTEAPASWDSSGPAEFVDPYHHARRLALFVGVLFLLSPLLESLTRAISSDTIWLFAFILSAVHLVYHNYGFVSDPRALFHGTISLNAAVFASVLLASRLSNLLQVFAVVLFAFEIFAGSPMVARQLNQAQGDRVHLMFTAAVSVTALVLLWWESRILGLSLLSADVFIMFICPFWLKWIQRFKNEIQGPWDVTMSTGNWN